MLTQIDLEYFKCFEALKLSLRSLTLLSGANASGKSSVMQALVLLHQTMREHEWSSRLMLNGAALRLGTVADVVDQVYGRRSCGIALLDGDGAQFKWQFEGERNEMSMTTQRASGRSSDGTNWDWKINESYPEPLRYLMTQQANSQYLTKPLRRLTYLTAERLGPRETLYFRRSSTHTRYWLTRGIRR